MSEPAAAGPLWIQDAAFQMITRCSALQRTAGTWRDRPRLDPMHVVIAARAAAVDLHAIANEIEAKCAGDLLKRAQP